MPFAERLHSNILRVCDIENVGLKPRRYGNPTGGENFVTPTKLRPYSESYMDYAPSYWSCRHFYTRRSG